MKLYVRERNFFFRPGVEVALVEPFQIPLTAVGKQVRGMPLRRIRAGQTVYAYAFAFPAPILSNSRVLPASVRQWLEKVDPATRFTRRWQEYDIQPAG